MLKLSSSMDQFCAGTQKQPNREGIVSVNTTTCLAADFCFRIRLYIYIVISEYRKLLSM